MLVANIHSLASEGLTYILGSLIDSIIIILVIIPGEVKLISYYVVLIRTDSPISCDRASLRSHSVFGLRNYPVAHIFKQFCQQNSISAGLDTDPAIV